MSNPGPNPTEIPSEHEAHQVPDAVGLGEMIGAYFNAHPDIVAEIPSANQADLRYTDVIKVTPEYSVLRGETALDIADIGEDDTERRSLATAIHSYFAAHADEVKHVGKYHGVLLRNIRLAPVIKGKLILVGTRKKDSESD